MWHGSSWNGSQWHAANWWAGVAVAPVDPVQSGGGAGARAKRRAALALQREKAQRIEQNNRAAIAAVMALLMTGVLD